MNRSEFNNIIFYIGPEITYTSAFSLKTLFVVGYRSVKQILDIAEKENCKAVYLGANGSYQNNKLWNVVIPELLDAKLKVTLEYTVEGHAFLLNVLDSSVWAHPNFIPVVNCVIANAETISNNLVFKVSDTGFNETNRGIWTIPKHELLHSNRYTSWSDFANDYIILSENEKNSKKEAEVVITADLDKNNTDAEPLNILEISEQLAVEYTEVINPSVSEVVLNKPSEKPAVAKPKKIKTDADKVESKNVI